MSYPKRHPVICKQDEKAIRLSQKKEQLKGILINKLRGKYSINADANPEVDQAIRQEVEMFLHTETMSEANLLRLDKKLQKQLGLSSAQQKGRSNKSMNREGLQSLNNSNGYKRRESEGSY